MRHHFNDASRRLYWAIEPTMNVLGATLVNGARGRALSVLSDDLASALSIKHLLLSGSLAKALVASCADKALREALPLARDEEEIKCAADAVAVACALFDYAIINHSPVSTEGIDTDVVLSALDAAWPTPAQNGFVAGQLLGDPDLAILWRERHPSPIED